LNSLSLILECRIIEHPVCIEKKIEIVEIDNRFSFEKNAKTIFVDKKIDILAKSQRQREDPKLAEFSVLYCVYSVSRVNRSLDQRYREHAFSEFVSSSVKLKLY